MAIVKMGAQDDASEISVNSLNFNKLLSVSNTNIQSVLDVLDKHTHTEINDLTTMVTWTTVPNDFISQNSVIQHQSALSITESQISDFGSYLSSINWGDLGGTISNQTDIQNILNSKMNKPSFVVKNSNYTAVSGDQLFIDTRVSGITITMPSNPNSNDYVDLVDYAGTFSINILTIARNGSKMMGGDDDLTSETNNISFRLLYIDNTIGWRLI